MAENDLALLQRDFPVSHALLIHTDLMTPVLIRHFGPVHAVQTAVEDHGDRVTRWSTLYQTETDTALLNGKLIITKDSLPKGVLDRFLGGRLLFGGVLMGAGIEVKITDRTVYRSTGPAASQAGTWGRRHRMVLFIGGKHLCDVDECLTDELTLRSRALSVRPKDAGGAGGNRV